MVRVNLLPASVFSLCNPGTVFQEKMHLCACKMPPLRVISSEEKNISHEVSLVLSVWFADRCFSLDYQQCCISFICDLQGEVKRSESICNQHFTAVSIRTRVAFGNSLPNNFRASKPALGGARDRLETEAWALQLPVLPGTSANRSAHKQLVCFISQHVVWYQPQHVCLSWKLGVVTRLAYEMGRGMRHTGEVSSQAALWGEVDLLWQCGT